MIDKAAVLSVQENPHARNNGNAFTKSVRSQTDPARRIVRSELAKPGVEPNQSEDVDAAELLTALSLRNR